MREVIYMRYCEKCGYVMDEFHRNREKQNCPICSNVWSEDDMTAIKYAELSEEEKDNYDEQLLNIIKNSPSFDEHTFYLNGNSTKDGGFWSGFRPEKWKILLMQNSDTPEWQIDQTIENRKKREPFKPFPPIDEVKAREVAKDAEITHKAIDRGYYSQNNTQKNVPKCPTCGSVDITRISTTAKVVNVAMFGLLGQKRKHQFKCKNCRYEW